MSNVSASQRDGTKIVDINYTLTLDSGKTAFVRLWFSPDNGLTYPVNCRTVNGTVGAGVSVVVIRQPHGTLVQIGINNLRHRVKFA